MKENTTYYRHACLLPVMKSRDSPGELEFPPIVTLATDTKSAIRQADDAGLVYVGQIDVNGNVIPPPPS